MQNHLNDNYVILFRQRSSALLMNLILFFQAFYYSLTDGLTTRNIISFIIPILSTLDIMRLSVWEFVIITIIELKCFCISFISYLCYYFGICFRRKEKIKLNKSVDVVQYEKMVINYSREIKLIPNVISKERLLQLKKTVDEKYEQACPSSSQ